MAAGIAGGDGDSSFYVECGSQARMRKWGSDRVLFGFDGTGGRDRKPGGWDCTRVSAEISGVAVEESTSRVGGRREAGLAGTSPNVSRQEQGAAAVMLVRIPGDRGRVRRGLWLTKEAGIHCRSCRMGVEAKIGGDDGWDQRRRRRVAAAVASSDNSDRRRWRRPHLQVVAAKSRLRATGSQAQV